MLASKQEHSIRVTELKFMKEDICSFPQNKDGEVKKFLESSRKANLKKSNIKNTNRRMDYLYKIRPKNPTYVTDFRYRELDLFSDEIETSWGFHYEPIVTTAGHHLCTSDSQVVCSFIVDDGNKQSSYTNQQVKILWCVDYTQLERLPDEHSKARVDSCRPICSEQGEQIFRLVYNKDDDSTTEYKTQEVLFCGDGQKCSKDVVKTYAESLDEGLHDYKDDLGFLYGYYHS